MYVWAQCNEDLQSSYMNERTNELQSYMFNAVQVHNHFNLNSTELRRNRIKFKLKRIHRASLLTILNEFTIANVKFIRKHLQCSVVPIEIASLWRFHCYKRDETERMEFICIQWRNGKYIFFLNLISKEILWLICELRVFWEHTKGTSKLVEFIAIANESVFKLNYCVRLRINFLVWIPFLLSTKNGIFSHLFSNSKIDKNALPFQRRRWCLFNHV